MEKRHIMTFARKEIRSITFSVPTIAGGGAERVVTLLADALADMGYEINIIVYERKLNEYKLSDKVHLHLLPSRTPEQNKATYYIKKFLFLRNLLKDIKPDVLIPFLPYQTEHCFFSSRGLNIPFVLAVRNNPKFDMPDKKKRMLRNWIAARSEAIFIQTGYQAEYFSPKLRNKMFVLPNPVSDSILDAQAEYRDRISRFVTIGRLEHQKRQDILIKAFSAVNSEHQLSLDIYGEGSMKKSLEDLIVELKQEDSIHLLGRTNDIANILTKYDLFILSSEYEGMPNALIEAMGVGLPCISSDCPSGPADLIQYDLNGLLFSVNDRNDLEIKIKWAIEHADEMRSKGINAKRFIYENNSAKKIAGQLIENLEKFLLQKQ